MRRTEHEKEGGMEVEEEDVEDVKITADQGGSG